jgi:hypothetical protein
VTSTETTAPIGRYPYLADAARQRDQLDRLLALEHGRLTLMNVDRDPDVLEQLVDAGYVSWAVQGYFLTDRGRRTALNLAALDAHEEHARREQAVADEAAVEQTAIMRAEGTLPGRHRIVRKAKPPRTPGWLLIGLLAVLGAFDRLITRVAFRIARFATAHARGLAWLVIVVPALAAGLVLGTCGVLWVIR